MSKQYTFIEMLQEYENDYTGEFKDRQNNIIIKLKDNILFKEDKRPVSLIYINMRDKYTKVKQEVTVGEAIMAIKEGKTVYSEFNGVRQHKVTIESQGVIPIYAIRNHKWYIED